MFNRKFFFDAVRLSLFQGKLSQQQVTGLTAILDEWEKWPAPTKDDRWLAYILATTHHETDRRIWPIKEYGLGKNRKYGVPTPPFGQVYYGRGFVQLTWDYNYKKCEAKYAIPGLLQNPDLALDLTNATKILIYGMIDGLFTGKKLADYFSTTKEDWIGARYVINGKDKARLISDYAHTYYAAISYTT